MSGVRPGVRSPMERLLIIPLNEPEAATVTVALGISQMVCPGFCVPCLAPVGGAVAGGVIVRLLRWWKQTLA